MEVIDSPEIKTVLHEIPHLGPFLQSFYQGQYSTFLDELLHIIMQMNEDRYLHPHCRYFAREMRIRAYQQFLESYRSVHLQSMATNFGVDTEFLDRSVYCFLFSLSLSDLLQFYDLTKKRSRSLSSLRELSHFIALGRLNCKIDKVNGIIETNRPDIKNAQYQSTIKQGDHLLNRIQKLSRVINL